MPDPRTIVINTKSIQRGQVLWENLARTISGYTERPEQIKLYKAIIKAINGKYPLLAEGPCGVGKSLAAILGFIASTGKRAIICTANNNLLSQYQAKDLPLAEDLASLSGFEMDWTMLQGKSNYICPMRWDRVRDKLDILTDESMRKLVYYVDGLAHTREHWLGHVNDMSKYEWIRSNLTIPAGRCKMSKCRYSGGCEMYQSRQISKHAEIVVTNYHLWILDTLQRAMLAGEENFVPMLGDYDVLIFDEAHELPNVARDYFKLEISDQFIASAMRHGTETTKAMLRLAWGMYKESFKDVKDGYVESFPVDRDKAVALSNALSQVHSDIMDLDPSKREDAHYKAIEAIERRISLCGDALTGNVTNKTHAYGIAREEKEGRVNFKLECIELSTGNILRRLYPRDIPIIAMSATICTSPGDFKFTSSQLGFDADYMNSREVEVDSPFDFSRSLVFTMNDSPPPNKDEEAWVNYCYRNLKEAIISLGGRVLALFTSTKRMNAVARKLKADEEIVTPVYAQGDMANSALVNAFRSEDGASLLGVASFWTGVDVSGDSLALLWIERVPFRHMNDLVSAAMNKILGKESFSKFAMPDALVRLKQGAGRLIRSKEDRGMVVFADGRLNKARYKGRVYRSVLTGSTKENRASNKSGNTELLGKYCRALRKKIEAG